MSMTGQLNQQGVMCKEGGSVGGWVGARMRTCARGGWVANHVVQATGRSTVAATCKA
jgi:hypothetical protein